MWQPVALQALFKHVSQQLDESAPPKTRAAAGRDWVRGWDDSWRWVPYGAQQLHLASHRSHSPCRWPPGRIGRRAALARMQCARIANGAATCTACVQRVSTWANNRLPEMPDC